MASRNPGTSTSRLPTRQSILDLFTHDHSALAADQIAKKLGVADASLPGLLRLLDDLALNGVLVARSGDRFQLSQGKLDDPPSQGMLPFKTNARPPAFVAKSARPERAKSERPRLALPQTLTKREPPKREPPKRETAKRSSVRPEAAEMPGFSVAENKSPTSKETPRGRPARETREGFLSITPRGAGFVSTVGESGNDVFVPRESIGGAMHGDRVEVAVVARGQRGPEGSIVNILERGVKRVAGVLRRRGKSAWLEPDDTRMRGPIVLRAAVDTTGPEGNSGSDGDAAVITVTRYPESIDENPEGVLEAVLGRPGELSVEAAKVLVTEQIEELHSEEAVREAEAYGDSVPAHMLEGRLDLTHLPLPTIDPEDARDHDDAVWVERIEGGGFRAWIAIADVSSYVRPDTQLDAEALKRGCSVYLPNRAIPMLPRALSSNLCSLLPDVIRLCLCAEVTLDEAGNIKSEKLHRAFMNSRAKLNYGGVARALGYSDIPPEQPKAKELIEGLRVAADLSRILRGRRMKRGALDFELPEAKIVLNEDGIPIDVERRSQDAGVKKAYQLIEELMLLANEVVARWLVAKQVPTVFRVHAPPDTKKLEKFLAMCQELSIPADVELSQDPKRLSELLKSMANHPKAPILNMLLLRSMKQAAYDIVNVGHFGLASKEYVHFTSPIRRYPDLVVHRAVHAVLLGQKIDRSDEAKEKLAEAALLASKNERRAMEVEREIGNLYRAYLMRDKVGEGYEGTITGLVGTGVYVALDSPFVDVLVKFDALGGTGWELDETGLRAVSGNGSEVKLGDRMMVQITDIAILRRTVYAKRVGGEELESKAKTGRGNFRGRGKKGAEKFAKDKQKAPKQEKEVRGRVRKIEKHSRKKGGKRR